MTPEKPCTICPGAEVAPAYVLDGLQVLRCRRCGLRYVDERMGTEEVEALYATDDYYGEHFWCHFPELETRLIDDYLADVARAERWLPPRPRVLDVGCADGRFLARLPGAFDKHGIDISLPAVEKGMAEFGLPLVCADILDKASDDLFEPASFDLITLWSVLEHLRDPRRVIERLARFLRPGGLLLVRVPNADGLLNTLAHLAYVGSAGRLRRPLERFYHRLHLYNFGRRQLVALLEGSGLDVRAVWGDERYVTKHALPHPPRRLAWPFRILRVAAKLLRRPDSITACAVLR